MKGKALSTKIFACCALNEWFNTCFTSVMARFMRVTCDCFLFPHAIAICYEHEMQDEKSPAVYIIAKQRYGMIYVGVTSGLWKRVWEHKNGSFDGFSKDHGLGLLVWYEHHPSMASTIHREKRLKKWRRSWKLNVINAFNPEWRDLHDDIDSNVNRVEEFASPAYLAHRHARLFPARPSGGEIGRARLG